MYLISDGRVSTAFAGSLIIVLAAAPFASMALAQQRTQRDTVGVGLHACERVNQAGLSTARTSPEATVADTEYSSWFYGWLTGFSVGSVEGGLGGIDTTDGQTWAISVVQSCRDAGGTYADAVRRVATEEILRRRSRNTRLEVTGFGRSPCNLIPAGNADAPGAYAGGYDQWAYGYASGYNTFRADVGLATLDIADETGMLAVIKEQCRRNPKADFNTAVAVWLLDAESRQNAAPIPADATPTATGLTAQSLRAPPNVSRPSEHEPIPGIGARTCESVISLFANESMDGPAALNEANALGWFMGYLSAMDVIRAAKRRPSVDWAAVDYESMWARAKNACRLAPAETFASIAEQREASLVREAPGGSPDVTNLGAGIRPCSYFVEQAPADVSSVEAMRAAAGRLLAESELIGWAEGYFSALNLHRRSVGLELLDLRGIGLKAREAVQSFCPDSSEPIARAMVRFGSRNYPGLFADLRAQ